MRLGACLLLVAAAAHAEARETEHFRLETEGDADELARLLEAAHAELVAHLKAKLPKGERIFVRVFPTEEAFRRAVEEGEVAGDPPALSVPEKRVAYVVRRPGRYATRALLLREVARIHYELARAKGRAAAVPWYRAGLLEFVAGHHWDGRTLRMGVVPLVAAEDLSGDALAEARSEGFDLSRVVEGAAPASRALSWALYGHVATMREHPKFAPKMDGGARTVPLFWQCFGRPPEYAAAFVKWLEASQQPFVALSGDWEGLAPGRLRGQSKGIGACRLKLPAAEMNVTIVAPKGRWRAGVVLSYAGEKDCALFLADAQGYLNIFRIVDGKRHVLEQGPGAPPSADGNYRIRLFRRKEKVYLMLEGGCAYGPWELPGDGFGLAVEGSDLVFSDVSWK